MVSGDLGLTPGHASWRVFDLGVLWQELTGQPLPCLLWTAGRGAPLSDLRRITAFSVRHGLDALARITDDASAHGVDEGSARTYLMEQLRFSFGSAEAEGLRTLVRLAQDHGLCPKDAALTFC